MIGAGLVAKKAIEHGLTVSPDIKTSLSPGSKVSLLRFVLFLVCGPSLSPGPKGTTLLYIYIGSVDVGEAQVSSCGA